MWIRTFRASVRVRHVVVNPRQPWKYFKMTKCRATAKSSWKINYFWVLCSLRVKLQILKIYLKYLSASILAYCYFQGCEIFMVGSSCADLPILCVVGYPFAQDSFMKLKINKKFLNTETIPCLLLLTLLR